MIPRYLIVIRGDTVDQMTEEALHFAYLFLSRALQRHRNESEYEDFAIGVLGLLQKYRHLYTTLPDPPNPN